MLLLYSVPLILRGYLSTFINARYTQAAGVVYRTYWAIEDNSAYCLRYHLLLTAIYIHQPYTLQQQAITH